MSGRHNTGLETSVRKFIEPVRWGWRAQPRVGLEREVRKTY